LTPAIHRDHFPDRPLVLPGDAAPGRESSTGAELYALVERLYPIRRSLTGDGVRETLAVLRERLPALEVREVPSGTTAFDWEVPKEWNLRAAWIEGPDGSRIVDAAESALHVVGYSVPVRQRLPLAELREHLHSLPEHPQWIPYRTAYWAETWGFCLQHERLEALPDGEYEVVIDATLADGHLTYGELALPGEREDEVLVSCHVCHPTLANDNCSGIAVAALLAAELASRPRRLSYRFLFVPGTIGPITWLALNEARAVRIVAGFVLAGVGDGGSPTWKRSRRGDAPIDRAMALALRERTGPHEIVDFTPFGYDERQYCSPGFDLPVGCLMRTPWGTYPEYHTSADDLGLVRPESLADTLDLCRAAVAVLEGDAAYVNLSPKGEPRLGKRGLYGAIGGDYAKRDFELALLWVLNQSDGTRSLLDVAERSGLPFSLLRTAADALLAAGLLRDRDGN
jgi:aminopeptidase-like protein